MAIEPVCTICKKPRSEHQGMRHAFVLFTDKDQGLRPRNDGSDASSSDKPKSQGSLGIAMRGDPVLRLALIRAGVITSEDLDKVEAELKASGLASVAPTPLA